MKFFVFDFETTGLDAQKHAPVELAFVYRDTQRDIRIVREYKLCPYPTAEINPDALAVTGKTLGQIMSYPNQVFAYNDLISTMDSVVDRFDKQDKVYPVAYNGHFDYQFLRELFIRNGNKYCGSYFNNKVLDPLGLLRYIECIGGLGAAPPNHRLSVVCEALGIELSDAHTALADTIATEKLFFDFILPHLKWEN